MLRDCLVCGLRNEKLQEGPDLTAETADKTMREIHQACSPPMAWKAKAVHSEEIVDSEEDKAVLRLCLRLSKHFGQQGGAGVPCTSCGGLHERQSCRFCDAQCWACGKTGHIGCACQTKEQWDNPQCNPQCPTLGTGEGHRETPRVEECHTISNCACTQRPAAMSIWSVQQPTL